MSTPPEPVRESGCLGLLMILFFALLILLILVAPGIKK